MLSNFCWEARQTAREHLIELKITYPFHPRCGETVQVLQRLTLNDAEFIVIPQPDGSVAQLPVWMTQCSAAECQIREVPRIPLEMLRLLRAEIGAVLGFLQSESTSMTEKAADAATNQRRRKSRALSARSAAAERGAAHASNERAERAGRAAAARDRRSAGKRGGR